MGLRRAARQCCNHGRRLLSLCDNLSMVCSFEKGRSDNFALRRLCQRAACIAIGCEIVWSHRYVETKRNPTDLESREADAGLLRPGSRVVGRDAIR
eukprot:1112060-Karenia_brevis.AAC.1